MLLRSRAVSTTKKYVGAYRWWKAWAQSHALQRFPAQAHHIALYLQRIGDNIQSVSVAEAAVNALAWVHGLAGLHSLTSNLLVQETLQGLKTNLGSASTEEKFLSLEQIITDLASTPDLSVIGIIYLPAL